MFVGLLEVCIRATYVVISPDTVAESIERRPPMRSNLNTHFGFERFDTWLFVCWDYTSWQHLRSGWVPNYDNAHSWRLYSAALLGYQATRTIALYPTQWHYPDTESTSPCPILMMPSAQSLASLDWELNSHLSQGPCSTDSVTAPSEISYFIGLCNYKPLWVHVHAGWRQCVVGFKPPPRQSKNWYPSWRLALRWNWAGTS